MDYNTLLDMATELGYELAMAGAETFRVEESILRIMAAYGIQAEVFAIPNYLIVSIVDEEGNEMESAPHPQQVLYIDLGMELDAFDILRRQEEDLEVQS